MYVVKLVKSTVGNVYKQDYFPRKIRYKNEAERLAAEVKSHGGEAVVEKVKK